jgi:hypothetical protein
MREQGGGVLFQPFLVDHESWAQQPLRLQRRGKLRKIFVVRLVYNWWTIFMRLGIPGKHAEAITSRPLALQGVARQTRHGNQTTVEITSTHAQAAQIAGALTKVSAVSQAHPSDCGAVDTRGEVAANSQRRVSSIPGWQGHRQPWPACRRPRLTAVFRFIGGPE